MERQATAAFLLFLFLLQTFSGTVIVAGFYANQGYIARNLCENRDRPQMRCNGNCQLSKRLKQADKKDQQSPDKKMDARYEVLRQENNLTEFQLTFTEPATSTLTGYRSPYYPIAVLSAPFHPPCA